MPTQDAMEFLQQFSGPGQSTSPGPTVKQDPMEFLKDYAPPITTPPATVLSPAPSSGVWPTIKYLGGRLAAGALDSGNAMAQAELGSMGQVVGDLPSGAEALGLGPPPNAVARYGGAVAEAFGQNPVLSALTPAATVGGALGSEAANQMFPDNVGAKIAGGFVGGSVAGGVQGLTQGLIGANSLKNIAKSINSGVGTLQDGGQALQAHAKDWIENILPRAENSAWAPVDEAMHRGPIMAGGGPSPIGIPTGPDYAATGGPPVHLDNLREYLSGVTSKGGALGEKLRSSFPQQLLDTLEGTGAPEVPRPPGIGTGPWRPIVNTPAPTEPLTMSWDDARYNRTQIGQQLNDRMSPLFRNTDEKTRRGIWGAITQDLRDTAQTHGVADQFDQANELSSNMRTLAEQNIAPLVAPGVTPEKALAFAMGRTDKGGSVLQTLRQEIPDGVDALAAAHLMRTPKGWSRLSPEAKAALVPDPALRGAVEKSVGNLLERPSHPGVLSTQGILGTMLGEKAGDLINPLLPISPTVSSIAGAGVPLLWYGGKSMMENPLLLRHPAAGMAAGAANRPGATLNNPLTGPSGAPSQ